jgi:hypothetical protein
MPPVVICNGTKRFCPEQFSTEQCFLVLLFIQGKISGLVTLTFYLILRD